MFICLNTLVFRNLWKVGQLTLRVSFITKTLLYRIANFYQENHLLHSIQICTKTFVYDYKSFWILITLSRIGCVSCSKTIYQQIFQYKIMLFHFSLSMPKNVATYNWLVTHDCWCVQMKPEYNWNTVKWAKHKQTPLTTTIINSISA